MGGEGRGVDAKIDLFPGGEERGSDPKVAKTEVVRVPVVAQRQMPIVENIWKTIDMPMVTQVPTITNEKEQLSQTGIDRTIQETERYRDKADANQAMNEAKSGLDNYCVFFFLRNTLTEKTLKDKFEAGDKEKIGKTAEIPKVQSINKMVDIPVSLQRNVSTFQITQKTVEVPRVQFIDKLVGDPTFMQRQVSTIQAAQSPNVPAFMLDTDGLCLLATGQDGSVELNEAADDDRLQHENKRRRLPKLIEAVFESRSTECKEVADGLDFERFEDLVLPPSQSCFDPVESLEEARDDGREGKTLIANVASGDEVEDDAEEEQAMTRSSSEGGSPDKRWPGLTRKALGASWSSGAKHRGWRLTPPGHVEPGVG